MSLYTCTFAGFELGLGGGGDGGGGNEVVYLLFVIQGCVCVCERERAGKTGKRSMCWVCLKCIKFAVLESAVLLISYHSL